jgi:branched-subunit amino acid aminotransferase/4-amino-4-deoxychorismate lyase
LVFLTGPAAEVAAIGELDGRLFDAPGPITRLVQDSYARAVRGAHPEYAGWLSPVC